MCSRLGLTQAVDKDAQCPLISFRLVVLSLNIALLKSLSNDRLTLTKLVACECIGAYRL
jgi:hypothetical protein